MSRLGDESRGLVGLPLLPNRGDEVASSDEGERVVVTTQSGSRASQAQKLLVGQTWRTLTAENLLPVDCVPAFGAAGFGTLVQ